MSFTNDLFLRYMVKNDVQMVLDYCSEVGRIKEIEEALLKIAKVEVSAQHLVRYARDTIKGRWQEAEERISVYPGSAVTYAQQVLKDRFPLYEQKIIKSKSKELMVEYCTSLKKRVPELEPHIAKGSFEGILKYAHLVIGGRFELAEAKIITKPKRILQYHQMLRCTGTELPDEMHTAMVMYSSQNGSDKSIKEYFSICGKK